MLILFSEQEQIKSRGISYQALARGLNIMSDPEKG